MQQRQNHALRKVSNVYSPNGAITLKRFFEDDPAEEPVTFEKIKPGARTRSQMQAKPTRKTSYESGTAVQRWLREQAYDAQQSSGFNPTLLASRRDAPWILSSLEPFYNV